MHVQRSLCMHIRRMAPVSFSEKQFSEGVRQLTVLCWENLSEDQLPFSFEDDLICAICFQEFIRSLLPVERAVLLMKLQHRSQKEIATSIAGCCEYRGSRLLKRIARKYLAFQEEEIHAV